MKLKYLKSLTILIISLVASTPTWAKEQSEDASIKLAQKELVQGLELIKSNRVKQGIRVLRRAYRVYPSPDILMLLGKVYDRFPQGCAKSLATWRLLVNTCQLDQCSLAQEALARLKVAEMECKGTLIIKTEPKKAEVFIDNQLQGLTPLEMEVDVAQPLKMVVFKDNYDVVEQQLKLQRKWKQHEVKLSLKSQRQHRGMVREQEKQVKTKHSKKVSSTKSSSGLGSSEIRDTEIRAKNDVEKSVAQDIAHQYKKHPQKELKKTEPTAIEQPKRKLFNTPKKLIISSPLKIDEDPFVRHLTPTPITGGKIARSAGRSMISDLRCQYRTRYGKYIDIEECDAAQLAQFDRFYLAVNLQQDAYVYVVMSNDKGQWQLMYPSPMEDNFIKAHQLTDIPKKEWLLFDQMEETTDVISILASPQPIKELEDQRETPDLNNVPLDLMRFFMSMSAKVKGRTSSDLMKRKTKSLIKGPLVLHTSYRIYR